MTVERERPGLWRVVCDACGDDLFLEGDDVEALVIESGWTPLPPETITYRAASSPSRVTYREHACPDCA